MHTVKKISLEARIWEQVYLGLPSIRLDLDLKIFQTDIYKYKFQQTLKYNTSLSAIARALKKVG